MASEHVNIDDLIVKPGKKVNLHKDFATDYQGKLSKEAAKALVAQHTEKMSDYQERLYAEDRRGILMIFQALDAAGKDGTIKDVMSGINPQGCQVFSFKTPSAEESDHDYLWRCFKCLPERGRFGIFNRSYYEEVLVVRVHPELLARQTLPEELKDKRIWKRRFEQINNFEKYLVENGIEVIKFYLNVSKKEQKRRFLERIDNPEKNRKFSAADVRERGYWDAYQEAYSEAFEHTSSEWAPWYVIPADTKYYAHLCVSEVLLSRLKKLDPQFPTVTDDHRKALLEARRQLEAEDD